MTSLSQYQILLILLFSAFTIVWLILFAKAAGRLMRKETRSIHASVFFGFLVLLLVPVIYLVIDYHLINY